MKRILHIISQYPGKTGSGIYLNELIRQGDKRGYEQGLIAAFSKKERDVDLNIPREYFYPVLFNTEQIPFPIVGMSDIMPYESTRYSEMTDEMLYMWKKEFKKTIKKAIDKFKPDTIISHHLWVLTSLVKKIAPDIRVIGICHGTDIRQFEKCPQYKQYVLEGCGQVDIVFSLNHKQRELIHKVYSIPMEKIVIIGGGYNEDIFYPSNSIYPQVLGNDSPHTIKLIYAGKLSFSKGVLSLIRAYNNLAIDEDEIELLIAGSGTGKEEKAIREAGKNSRLNVRFLGDLPQEKLGQIFRESHIFVLPSFFEGLSLVTIEALASGLMVVATAIPGLISFLGDKINNSGIIEYIDLPKLDYVDIPVEEELLNYEKRLKEGIEKQINRLKEEYIIDNSIRKEIEKLSWSNIYKGIEGYF